MIPGPGLFLSTWPAVPTGIREAGIVDVYLMNEENWCTERLYNLPKGPQLENGFS